jgi:hypothetical protein
MDLWIGVEDRGTWREVQLQGRLAGEAIAEFGRLVRSLESPVRFDMRELFSVDDAGLETLRGLRDSGHELYGVRPLVQSLLDGGQEKATPEVDKESL